MVWFALVVLAVFLAWAKYRLEPRAYRLFWYVAVSTMIVAGLVL